MKARVVLFALVVLLSTVTLGALAQDTNPSQDPGQSAQGRNPGQRGGRGGFGGGMMGRGVMGTVTEIAPDHFTIKTDSGEVYTVHYSVNTRIMKGGGGQRRGQGGDNEPPMNPPTTIKASDIKVGDAIGASGEMDANTKSVGAVVIFQIDPERAKQMREMQANYGKTWIMGKVTAINELKVTLQGGPDNATHTFVADENTTFRKRRDPITLGDIQVGDMVRAEGAIKNGAFLATAVAVMGQPPQRNDTAAPVPPPQ
jgi:preprotein translocase subunit YajC